MSQTNNKQITIAKAIGIILVVIGHAQNNDFLHNFIYLFHMPLFFFLSGYFFKPKYVEDKRTFIVKRIKGLYWPFVKWGLIFLVLHNVFYHLNIYNSIYGYHGKVSVIYSTNDFITKGLNTLKLAHYEQLLGAYWFLHDLFFVSIIGLFYFSLSNRIFSHKVASTIGIIVFLVLALVFSYLNFHLPFSINAKVLLGVSIYWLGFYFHTFIEHKISYSVWGLSVALIILVVCASYLPTYSMRAERMDIVFYFIISSIGIYFTMNLSYYILKISNNNILEYIGNNTLDILTFHFLAFKIVSYLYIKINHLPIENISKFPVIYHNILLAFCYSMVGICIPLLLIYISNALSKKIKIMTSSILKSSNVQ